MKRMKIACVLVFCSVGAVMMSPASSASAQGGSTAIDGVYRVTWTENQLIAAGMTRQWAHKNFGVVTLTLKNGQFIWQQVPPPSCAGKYTVSGHNVSFRFTRVCTGAVRAQWSLSGARLRLHVAGGSDRGTEIVFGGKPWKKIG
jgi:hypothetical protein